MKTSVEKKTADLEVKLRRYCLLRQEIKSLNTAQEALNVAIKGILSTLPLQKYESEKYEAYVEIPNSTRINKSLLLGPHFSAKDYRDMVKEDVLVPVRDGLKKYIEDNNINIDPEDLIITEAGDTERLQVKIKAT